jgi:hypothetical protein
MTVGIAQSIVPAVTGWTVRGSNSGRLIFSLKYINGRRNGLVTFCVETAFYNGLLKERYKGG